MLAKGVLIFCTSYAQNNSSWYLGEIFSSPPPCSKKWLQAPRKEPGKLQLIRPVSPRQMPVVSEWHVQGVEVATWESFPHRARSHCPYSSLDATQGDMVAKEGEGVLGGRVLMLCASSNSLHVIYRKIEPNCPALSRS